ncbi:MAG: hypothetical protein Q8L84_16570 [Hyphomonas sp.]|nr:hypothetical protein [Hyphomonas sp.]
MAGNAPAPFAAWHRWDRNFFLAFVAACWLGAVMGFAPAVTARFTGQADYEASTILQVHAFAYPAWLVLITLQVLLIRTKRTPWHRRLGLSALGLIPVMAVSGIWSEILSQRFYGPGDPLTQSFFIIPLFYTAAFVLLAGAALAMRKHSSAHKRLILLATATIVGAAYTRWWGEAILSVTGDGFFGMIANTFTPFWLMAGAAVLYDWITRRQVHTAYLVALPLLLAAHLGVSAIYHTEGWRPIARAIAGI